MPLFVSIAMILDGNTVFNHTCAVVAPTEAEAIERAKADLASSHPPAMNKEIMGASIISIDPSAIREAYAELPAETLQ